MRQRSDGGEDAFTLTDLLVVLAVSAVLAALVLPALGAADLQGQRLGCASNLKQLLNATLGEVADSNGNFPNYNGASGKFWMGDLIQYDAHVSQVLVCPSANRVSDGIGACDTSWEWVGIKGSYNFNGWLYSGGSAYEFRNDVSDSGSYMFTNLASIQMPALTPIFCDAVWLDSWPMPFDSPSPNLYLAGGNANPPAINRIVIPRHGWKNPSAAPTFYNLANILPGGVNLGLSDGHVEMPRLELLWSYYWNRGWVVPKTRPGLNP
jgi:type II secretory pathway pseudopilin PulG